MGRKVGTPKGVRTKKLKGMVDTPRFTERGWNSKNLARQGQHSKMSGNTKKQEGRLTHPKTSENTKKLKEWLTPKFAERGRNCKNCETGSAHQNEWEHQKKWKEGRHTQNE